MRKTAYCSKTQPNSLCCLCFAIFERLSFLSIYIVLKNYFFNSGILFIWDILVVTYTLWMWVSMCFHGCENSCDLEECHYSSDQDLYKSLTKYMLLFLFSACVPILSAEWQKKLRLTVFFILHLTEIYSASVFWR